ncbi:MAG: ergothioneine biosynthesis protein EgtB [Pseudomonadota bacterium]
MPDLRPVPVPSSEAAAYRSIRERTVDLCAPLSDADATLQSMPDASPAKWHLAHTTWFFETFILIPALEDYTPFHPDYNYLFNSYYEAIGERHARPQRGMLSRPSLEEIYAYRAHVDASMVELLDTPFAPDDLVTLGLHHEQQHQELLLTDILHAFAQNPCHPQYRPPGPVAVTNTHLDEGWTSHEGGMVSVGAQTDDFTFDCETPQHPFYLAPFKIKNRAVTNKEWKEFIADGGYDDPLLWLSDGWTTRLERGWTAPLYWQDDPNEGWCTMTLRGWQPIGDDAPVCHISYYEADAFASWAGHRLPTEQEWETIARTVPQEGNNVSTKRLRPAPQMSQTGGPQGMFGDVWEWTRSAFLPYPGFQAAKGAVGEYNGKFMSGQMVLRGGSCVTPEGHIRPTYRNFFHPDKRWQFSGLRLATDL